MMSLDVAIKFYETCEELHLKTVQERKLLMEILRKEGDVVGLTKSDIQRQLKKHKKVLKIQ